MRDGFVKVAAATSAIKVADCEANAKEIIRIVKEADAEGVKVIAFPELCTTGYSCADLFFSDVLIKSAEEALGYIVKETAERDILFAVGLPVLCKDKLYNCAAVAKSGKLLGIVPKANIPNHAEFNEIRYFAPAPEDNGTVYILGEKVPFGKNIIFNCEEIKNLRIAAEICEDLWVGNSPAALHCSEGATLILNLSASNEAIGKDEYRRLLVKSQSARLTCAYVFANAGKGESTTDLVFSGHNLIAENGKLIAEKLPFESAKKDYIVTEIDVDKIAFERRRISTYESNASGKYDKASFSLKKNITTLTRRIAPNPFVPENESEVANRCASIISIQANGLSKRIEAAYAKKCVVAVSGGLDSCLALLVTVKAMDMLGRPHSDIIAVTMPCFGTTKRTKSNAEVLCTELATDFRCVDISEAVNIHFRDIGHDPKNLNVVYENVQARERTQVIMDIANEENGLVIGTGDLSELALGWATYNGDHMSMYGVNASVPKTLIRHIVAYVADSYEKEGKTELAKALRDILATPVSPELLPAKDGEISQKTEDIVGPYELHDFYLYYMVRYGFSPRKLYRLSEVALGDLYDSETRLKWLEVFTKRFFAQQFKRSCLPDGPKVGSVSLSPRGDWKMPSDASSAMWLKEIEELKK
ncbi:MAG: NAD(+) synthase [Ruminococcaceae bacterium]|nr:NAD(+) synthase [Oscillospiraceae bacterium]